MSTKIKTFVMTVGERTNLTIGHEAVGSLRDLGSEMKSFKPGGRVDYVKIPRLVWGMERKTTSIGR